MIRLLVVSSMRSQELGKFLAERGTFEIYRCYDSFKGNAEDLQNSIIKVDKTLYLYQLDEDGNSNVNIRADMQLLQRMLQSNAFFHPGEIVFMTQDEEQSRQAERYFVSVMEECQYKNYSLQNIGEKISFSKVYSCLMGITEDVRFQNTYKPLWRAEKGSESSTAYEAQENRNLLLEPFTFENVKKYDNQKKVAAKATAAIEIKDTTDGMLKQYSDPNFHRIRLGGEPLQGSVCLVTGKSKSGLSIWSSVLAISASVALERVLLLDYTGNQDIVPLLQENGIDFNQKRMKELLRRRPVEEGLSVCGIVNDKEESIKMEFVQHFFAVTNSQFSQIIIAVDNVFFEKIFQALRGVVCKVFLTVVPRHPDVVELQKFIQLFQDGDDITVLMNESMQLEGDNYLTQQEVKNLLPFFSPRVVKSIWFKSLKVKANLYNKLLKER